MFLLKTYFKTILLTIGLCLGLLQTHATHFMGVDISYQCLNATNNCTYRIFHNTYYDCAGAATTALPGPPIGPILQTFQPAACIQPVPLDTVWTFVSYSEVTPICGAVSTQCTSSSAVINGVLEARFYRDYDFCNVNCNKINIIWGSCCRNGTIISGAANDGMYSGFTEIDLGLTPCNSSPIFTSSTVSYLCAGLPYTISQGAVDPDGDSLVFQLTACYDNATAQVGYNFGFSPTQPLGTSWTVSMNSSTGLMTFIPNPGNQLIAVVCISIEEYRNGQMIGKVYRDMQVNVISCAGSNTSPQVDSLILNQGGKQVAPWGYEMCIQDTLELSLYASDVNNTQSLTVDSVSFVPGLSITSQSNNPVVATIKFAPSQKGHFSIPFTVVDDFCPLSGRTVQLVDIHVTEICHTATIIDAPCGQATGSIDLMVTGPSAPFQFLWSTGDTTEDINLLLPGRYSVAITDVFSVVVRDTFFVNASDVVLNPTLTQPTCANPVGTISLAVTGGIPPYSYLWNTNDTTATVSNLPVGGYSVTLSDSTGCFRHEAFVLRKPDSCFNIIRGRVFHDLNKNCLFDLGEPPIPFAVVDVTPGGANWTDSSGIYQLQVDTGKIEIHVIPPIRARAACPPGGSHHLTLNQVGNILNNYNFAIRTDSIQDLTAFYSVFRVRPVDTTTHYLRVKNNGDLPMNGTFEWVHDSVFHVANLSPAPSSYNIATRKAKWNFFNLAPLQTMTFRVKTVVPITTPLGYAYSNSCKVLPINGDAFPADNTKIVTGIVRGSYDPNDKQASPEGIGPLGLIEQLDQRINYNIRFQNTGTDTAFYVIIRDTIDTQTLDIFSFQRMRESHPYSLTIEDDKVLVFRFDHINLPDSATNNPGSQGFVSFVLHHKGTLPIGTQIRNTAAIYFDFNPPIITNTTLHTIFAYPMIALGDSNLCAGDTLQATLGATGVAPFEFYWSNGTVELNNLTGISQTVVNDSGTLQVKVIDALGNEVEDGLAVTIAPEPNAVFVVSGSSLEYTFTDTSKVNTSWYWDFGDGNTTIGGPNERHFYAPGRYTVTLIAGNECGLDTFQQVIEDWVGIEESSFAQSIQLVPHPVQDISYLQFVNPHHEGFRLRVLDLQGRVVQEYPATQGERFEIARGNLAAGIYMYELIGSHSFYGKMVVR